VQEYKAALEKGDDGLDPNSDADTGIKKQLECALNLARVWSKEDRFTDAMAKDTSQWGARICRPNVLELDVRPHHCT
jgi:hypothetical protein